MCDSTRYCKGKCQRLCFSLNEDFSLEVFAGKHPCMSQTCCALGLQAGARFLTCIVTVRWWLCYNKLHSMHHSMTHSQTQSIQGMFQSLTVSPQMTATDMHQSKENTSREAIINKVLYIYIYIFIYNRIISEWILSLKYNVCKYVRTNAFTYASLILSFVEKCVNNSKCNVATGTKSTSYSSLKQI